jgi:hypothetical protein
MNNKEALFERMNSWRHLPNYQLERRADLFFSLYLSAAVSQKLENSFSDFLIPEFPVHINTIYPQIPSDKSFKIDYVAISKDGKHIAFIELKTDSNSRRDNQDKYLLAANKVGIQALLKGIVRIFQATNSKRKYYYLLRMLEDAELIQIPCSFKEIMTRTNLTGINEAAQSIAITSREINTTILYVQPNGDSQNTISFEEFADIVDTFDDKLSQLFSNSLRQWAKRKPGEFQ